MKEHLIRKKAIEILEKKGCYCWYPYKSRWAKESDVFGVFDLICGTPEKATILFIQLTTIKNIRAREGKILTFFRKNKIEKFPAEVWGWNDKKNEFKIIKINGISCS